MEEWTYDNPKKRSGTWEYLYLLIKDKTGQYPNGKVLLAEHSPYDEHECHDRILSNNKFFKSWAVKSPIERENLIKQGFTPLNLDDILDVGRIRYERNGTRYVDMRTRWSDFAKDYKHRRKAIKLVYAVIKKRQKARLDWATSRLDSNKTSDETNFVAYAPQDTSVENAQIFLLKNNQTLTNYIREKQLEPWRILTVGRLKPDAQNPNRATVCASYALTPYEHTKEANERAALKKWQDTLKSRIQQQLCQGAAR